MKRRLLVLFACIAALFLYVSTVSFAALSPGQTLDPVGEGFCSGPGDIACAINYGSGSSLWSLAANNSDIFFDSGLVGVGLDIPLAQLHVKAGQIFVPGTPGSPAIPGVVGQTTYTGSGLDDAVFGGTYDGVEDCTLAVGIATTTPDNGIAVDQFIWGWVGGNCNGGINNPVNITPNIPQELYSGGPTITFSSATGHTLVVMGQNLDEFWSVSVTAGTPEVFGTPDEYVDVDPFLVQNSQGLDFFNITSLGQVIMNNPADGITFPEQYALLVNAHNQSLFGVFTDGLFTFRNVGYYFPTSQGGANTVLTNDGSGNLSWEDVVGSSGFTIDDVNLNMYAGTNTGNGLTNNYGNNLFIGINSGISTTSGNQNTFIGNLSGRDNTTGTDNTFIGLSGISNTTGSSNTFLGTNAGVSNTTGSGNTFLGNQSGHSNTTGYSNTANGSNALNSNTTGSENTVNGNQALFSNTTGSYNTANGNNSLFSNTTGSENTANGHNSLYLNTTGFQNTANGHSSLSSNTTGYYNTSFGYGSGNTLTTGGTNTIIGAYADTAANFTTGSIALGYGAIASSNQFALPDSITTWKFQGDSYTLPISYPGASGYVLSSTDTGVMSWVTSGSSPISIGTHPGTLYSSGFSGTGQGDTVTGENIFLGDYAGYNAVSTYRSNFFGAGAGNGATDASNSNFLGYYAGRDAESAAGSNFLGYFTGNGATDAFGSNFFGAYAGFSAASANNSNFFGSNAGQIAASANNSNFFGTNAGNEATFADNSNFFGQSSGNQATSASNSNFFGREAGNGAVSASNSNFFGYYAGYQADNATYSNFIGNLAGFDATNANNSTFIGQNAGGSNGVDTGSQNSNNSIFIGNNAGYTTADFTLNNSTADFHSILIGDDTSTGGYSNSIALGKGATNTATNQLMIGSTLATGSIESVRIQAATTECTITTGTGIACSSDERLKTNIEDMTNILDKVLQLRTVTYNWNDRPNTDAQIGFLAQDLEQYFPELVTTNEKGLKSVYYSQITPILVAAIKEIDLKILDIQTLSDETFLSRIRNWFADAGNGIQKFFAKEIYTEQICVAKSDGTDFCVNGDQLESVMNGSGNQIIYSSNNNNQDDSNDADEPVVDEPSDSEDSEEINDSSESDIDGETDVNTGASIDESSSEDQSTQDDAPTESSSESDGANQDSGAGSDSSIDE